MAEHEDDLASYEDVAETSGIPAVPGALVADAGAAPAGVHATYTGVRISGFKDLLLRPEILKAIGDVGFEHPSQVQHECLTPAMNGEDILCQAKSGMGKTAVFVLSALHNLQETIDECGDKPRMLVIAHTREMAMQHLTEFRRFSKYLPALSGRMAKFHGGSPRQADVEVLRTQKPLVITGTPGRLIDLAESGDLDLSKIDTFIVDECDRLLQQTDTNKQITALFVRTPRTKQTMMFTATLPEELKKVCKRFLRQAKLVEVYVEGDAKLFLHGLEQFYMKVQEDQKIAALFKLLDENRAYNQVMIFVQSGERVKQLTDLMVKNKFPTYGIAGNMETDQRLAVYNEFKQRKRNFLVTTDLCGRGVDIQDVNMVINFDCPRDVKTTKGETLPGTDQYLHRIGRAGRFGTRGVSVTFVASADDADMMNSVQKRFEVVIKEVTLANVGELTKSLAAAAQ
eukprot:TRINITY_DN3999_c0_g1_i1.p2 TRINITY_DN3999_c0_g1~~TRINITY_DN3999_c0_g1_i1.p2  ORF type:complete len:455 (+),score=120.34 TRINITY_DN3999_c0_g1_i1:64-1428(+)